MLPTPSHPSIEDPCTYAGRGRRVLHYAVSLAGWALFVDWWALVLRRVSAEAVTFTAIFIAVATVVSAGLTVSWIRHNLRLFERRRPRTRPKEVREDYSCDVLGRMLRFEPKLAAIRRSPVVEVRIDGGIKIYAPGGRAGRALDDRPAAAS